MNVNNLINSDSYQISDQILQSLDDNPTAGFVKTTDYSGSSTATALSIKQNNLLLAVLIQQSEVLADIRQDIRRLLSQKGVAADPVPSAPPLPLQSQSSTEEVLTKIEAKLDSLGISGSISRRTVTGTLRVTQDPQELLLEEISKARS